MKKALFKTLLLAFVAAATLVLSPLEAAEVTAVDECARELLLSYFPAPIVNETLKHFDVPSDKWAGIVKSLADKDKDVVKLVEQKASTMDPNPLKDPQQRQAAVKLFRDTLLQVLTDALKDNGITDVSRAQSMLEDIQQQKAKMFAMCMEKHRQAQQSQGNDQLADADEEDDDSDEEEIEEDEEDESATGADNRSSN